MTSVVFGVEATMTAVVTDTRMPIMDGLAMTRALQRLDPDVVVMDLSMGEMDGTTATRVACSMMPWSIVTFGNVAHTFSLLLRSETHTRRFIQADFRIEEDEEDAGMGDQPLLGGQAAGEIEGRLAYEKIGHGVVPVEGTPKIGMAQ